MANYCKRITSPVHICFTQPRASVIAPEVDAALRSFSVMYLTKITKTSHCHTLIDEFLRWYILRDSVIADEFWKVIYTTATKATSKGFLLPHFIILI